MSKAYQCDRCGEYVDSKQTVAKVSELGLIEGSAVKDNGDLCESCESDFDDFMNNDLTESRGIPSLATKSVEFTFEENEREAYMPPNHPMETRFSFRLSKPTKNYFGDAERAKGVLDDQIEGGHRNY